MFLWWCWIVAPLLLLRAIRSSSFLWMLWMNVAWKASGQHCVGNGLNNLSWELLLLVHFCSPVKTTLSGQGTGLVSGGSNIAIATQGASYSLPSCLLSFSFSSFFCHVLWVCICGAGVFGGCKLLSPSLALPTFCIEIVTVISNQIYIISENVIYHCYLNRVW